MKKWCVKEHDEERANKFALECGVTPFSAKLLMNRGIENRAEAEDFIAGEEISSPLEIKDMEKAARIIEKAIDDGDKITVYGDYDCDGITATAILYGYLEAMGAEADWYLPGRDEGYGLNNEAIDKIARSGTKLIVTVDNGISAFEEARYIKKKGMELIITDHHQPSEELPEALAVVNPHRKDDNSSCTDLAGCGVALKLVMAIEGETDNIMEQYSSLAALGTVADLVPLWGENRIIVKDGVRSMPMTENEGLRLLLQKCGLLEKEEISSADLGFVLCPRINAAGRIGHPKTAEELLLGDNPRMLPQMAESLLLVNSQRQEQEKEIFSQIESEIAKNPKITRERVIVVSGKDWNHGVIGLVASRLLNRFDKPVIVITDEGETARGSCRSIKGFSVFELLTAVSDMLVKFGGHEKAGGFSVKSEKIEELTQKIYGYARENFPEMPKDVYTAEMSVKAAELTLENIEETRYFQPFGEGNPLPVLHMGGCRIKNVYPLKEGKYLSFTIDFEGREFRVLNFHSAFADFPFKPGDNADLMVNAEINEYGGSRTVSLKLLDIRFCGFDQDKFFAAENAYEKLCIGEEIPKALAARIIPGKQAEKTVYDIIKGTDSISSCGQIAFKMGINYCMFRVTLDLFKSVGLIGIDAANDRIILKNVKNKVDLDNCAFMSKLKKILKLS